MKLKNALWAMVLPICLASNVAMAEDNRAAAWDELNKAAMQFYHDGNTDKAIETEQKALKKAEEIDGASGPKVAASLFNLAMLYDNALNFTKAEPLYKRALEINDKAATPDLRETGKNLFGLGTLYFKQQKYAEGEPYLKRSLDVGQKLFGADSPNVIVIENRLSLLYQFEDKPEMSIPHLQHVLEIQEKLASDKNDPQIAIASGNLGGAYLLAHQSDKAEAAYKRALEIEQKNFGAEDPNVVNSMNALASAYIEEKKYNDAEQLYLHALRIQTKAQGDKNPDVANTYTNLGKLYWAMGQVQRSKEMEKKAREMLGLKDEDEAAPASK